MDAYNSLPGLSSFCKMLIVGGLVAFVKLGSLDAFFAKLDQAAQILCSGDQDFVVALVSELGFEKSAHALVGQCEVLCFIHSCKSMNSPDLFSKTIWHFLVFVEVILVGPKN